MPLVDKNNSVRVIRITDLESCTSHNMVAWIMTNNITDTRRHASEQAGRMGANSSAALSNSGILFAAFTLHFLML